MEIRTFIDVLRKDRQLQRVAGSLDSLIRFTVNTFRWQSRHGASKQQAGKTSLKRRVGDAP